MSRPWSLYGMIWSLLRVPTVFFVLLADASLISSSDKLTVLSLAAPGAAMFALCLQEWLRPGRDGSRVIPLVAGASASFAVLVVLLVLRMGDGRLGTALLTRDWLYLGGSSLLALGTLGDGILLGGALYRTSTETVSVDRGA